jgi:uncharacterized protein YidB (DUF937 family)
MGLLDSVIGALGQAAGGSGGGGGGGGQQAALMNAVLALLADNGGGGGAGDGGGTAGLGALVAKLQQAGLGDVVNSWISTWQNLPLSGDQLQGALGSDTLGPLARQLGLGEGDLAGGLAGLLPQVVDGLTPDGQLPSGGATPDLGALIGSLLAR